MNTTPITVSAKKGHSQTLTFSVRQDHPFPDTEGRGSYLRWRNGGDIFPQYGRPGGQLERRYHAYLLRTDMPKDELPPDRRGFAGYKPEPDAPANPGSLTLRGQDLGEMSIEWNAFNTFSQIKVRGFDNPTPGERHWIEEHIVPELRKYADQNEAKLYAEAVESLRTTTAEKIKELRQSVDKLESEAAEAIKQLNA